MRQRRWPHQCLFPRRYFRNRVRKLPPAPAFLYHQVEPEEFSATCRGIAAAGLPAWTVSDLLERRSGDGDRAVLLTFDDGWSSVWSIAFPLARRHGLRFTLFVVPRAVVDSDEVRSTLDDGADAAELVARDRGSAPTLTWGEVRALHGSGIVDIESHSLHHGVVFASDQLETFQTPAGPFPLYGHAPLLASGPAGDAVQTHPEPGTPIYRQVAALAATRRYLDDPVARARCVERVRHEGGAAFFERPDWQRTLERELGPPGAGVWETDAERRLRLLSDLIEARQEIECRVPGLQVRALAPPWSEMHDELPEIAARAGHEIVVLGFPYAPGPSTALLPMIPRLFGDAIWTLLDGPLRGGIGWLRSRRKAIARRRAGAIP